MTDKDNPQVVLAHRDSGSHAPSQRLRLKEARARMLADAGFMVQGGIDRDWEVDVFDPWKIRLTHKTAPARFVEWTISKVVGASV